MDIQQVIIKTGVYKTSSCKYIGGLIACLYASSGLKHQDIDGVILNSPYLAALEISTVESLLLGVLTNFRLSTEMDDK